MDWLRGRTVRSSARGGAVEEEAGFSAGSPGDPLLLFLPLAVAGVSFTSMSKEERRS